MVPAKVTTIKLRRGRKKNRPILPKELTGRKYLEIIGSHRVRPFFRGLG